MSMSSTGKYMLLSGSSGVLVSSDYGVNFSLKSSGIYLSTALAYDGSVMYGAKQYDILMKSTDYGETWSQVATISDGTIGSIHCSGDGKYVIVCMNGNDNLYVSSNYGATWSSVSNSNFILTAMSNDACNIYSAPYSSSVYKNDARLVNIATSAPYVPTIGSSYIDSNKLYIYNGSAWKYASLA
jgi:hypothetical protein